VNIDFSSGFFICVIVLASTGANSVVKDDHSSSSAAAGGAKSKSSSMSSSEEGMYIYHLSVVIINKIISFKNQFRGFHGFVVFVVMNSFVKLTKIIFKINLI
jgi:hypothetical protein